ncbi:MAG: hypothetical protein D6753_14970 [Planctomycetota bacterium]|nr:MAG: hypothetical protein D6753_14970 [Planctomycetota bacterium]
MASDQHETIEAGSTRQSQRKATSVSYWRYWKMSGPPFAFSTRQALHRGDTVEEALARIEFLISNRRQVATLIGPSGCGKTALLRYVVRHPPITAEVPAVHAVRLSLIGLDAGDMFCELAARLIGGGRAEDSRSAWNAVEDYLRSQWQEEVQLALLLDDMESALPAAQADVGRLLATPLPVTIVLSVAQEALGALSPELRTRSELNIDLPAWTTDQTGQFLAWACERVGRPDPIFTQAAIERLQQLSGGIARCLIQAADLALVAGAVAGEQQIDADCIDQVAAELPKAVAA